MSDTKTDTKPDVKTGSKAISASPATLATDAGCAVWHAAGVDDPARAAALAAATVAASSTPT